jgi:cysteine synthase A
MNDANAISAGIGGDVTTSTGGTPLVAPRRRGADHPGRILFKMESRNPFGSVKDRIALPMIRAAAGGELPPTGSTIVEATSGNTGIALAWVGAALGYQVVLTMPDTMSEERRRLLQALGAVLELTDGREAMNGAVLRAEEIGSSTPGALLVRQFSNTANPRAHEETTGPEIWAATQGRVDVFVAGVGTGGTISGVGRALRARNPSVEIVAVEPAESPVISGGSPGAHAIQGIGAGFVPPVLDRSILNGVETVSADEAARTARRLAREEGILGGISAGANAAVALRLAALESNRGKTIVTVICDTGERYLSTWLYEEE